MKLEHYGKFSGSVLLYNANKKNKPIVSEVFSDPNKLIKYISDAVGTSLRKSDISKITINVKVHSAKYGVDFTPELYMTGWEKSNYSMCLPGQLINSIRGYLDSWLDANYSKERMGKTELERIGIAYEN